MTRPDRATSVGLLVVAASFVAYWLADRGFDAGRGDFFFLADAFLHGRSWLDFIPGPYDVIVVGARYYVPFAPFPAVALMPLVALIGPQSADAWEPGINAALAAASVGLCWWLVGRLGVRRLVDRGWLILLFGFSTQILWVTTRGGVWHTGHLIATVLTLACLIELWGRQRALLIGLLAGAAFLTRAPVAFAIPFYALLLLPWLDAGDAPRRTIPWRSWALLAAGVLPSIVGFFAYNVVRFGDPLESGYALATLPPFLDQLREQGLFSLVARRDEPAVLPPRPAETDPRLPVLPPGRARDVGLRDDAGAPAGDPRRLAVDPDVAAPRRGRGRPHPDSALLRGWMAPVRLPLLP